MVLISIIVFRIIAHAAELKSCYVRVLEPIIWKGIFSISIEKLGFSI